MKEDLSLAGLPGMVKRVAQRLQLEGEEGEMMEARDARAREAGGRSPSFGPPLEPLAVEVIAEPGAAVATATQPPPAERASTPPNLPALDLPPQPPLAPMPDSLDDPLEDGYSEFSYSDRDLSASREGSARQ